MYLADRQVNLTPNVAGNIKNENNCKFPLVNFARPTRSFNVAQLLVINGNPVDAIDVANAITTIVNLSGLALKSKKDPVTVRWNTRWMQT